jgi:signal transduction histidine kinase
VQNRVRGTDASAAKKLQGLLGVLDQAIAIKRRVTEELHPTLLDNLGLGAALQWHVKEVCGRAGLVPDVKMPAREIALPDQVAVALFRIVQEALTNTVKYAKARKVTVALSRSAAGVALVVADDGVGLPPPAERRETAHGMLGMRERVRALRGELVIKSKPNAGTSIEVFVPTAAGRRRNGHSVPPSKPGEL